MNEEQKSFIDKEYARLNAVLYLEKVKSEFNKQYDQHFITIDKANAIVNKFIKELEKENEL